MKRLIEANEINDYIQELCNNSNYNDDKIQLLEDYSYLDLEIIKYVSQLSNISEMENALNYFKHGMTLDGFKNFNKNMNEITKGKNFNNSQLEQIERGLRNNLKLDQIKTYAKPEYDEDLMALICELFIRKMPDEKIKYILNPNMPWQKADLIFDAICDRADISEDKIKYLAESNLDITKLKNVVIGFQDNLSIEQVKLYENYDLFYSQLEQIIIAFKKNKYNNEEIEYIINPNFNYLEMQLIMKALDNNLKLNQVKFAMNDDYSFRRQQMIIDALINGIPNDLIELYSKLDVSQINEINTGYFTNNLKDKVRIYATPEYTSDQMEQIRFWLTNPDVKDKVDIILNKDFSASQMRAIRQTLLNHNEKIVKLFAKPEFSTDLFWDIKMGLDDRYLNYDKVKYFSQFNEDKIHKILSDFEDGMTLKEVKEKYGDA